MSLISALIFTVALFSSSSSLIVVFLVLGKEAKINDISLSSILIYSLKAINFPLITDLAGTPCLHWCVAKFCACCYDRSVCRVQ